MANIENKRSTTLWSLTDKVDTPMSLSYVPYIYGKPKLNNFDMSWYQELIGVLHWEILLVGLIYCWKFPYCPNTSIHYMNYTWRKR